MRILKEIYLNLKDTSRVISFGLIDNEQEMEEMFRLRYKVYSKMGYISKEMFPQGLEKDEYDERRKCDYFIAKFKNQIVGTVRIIKDYYLPTEKDCFKFKEPLEIKEIPRDKRCEISRFIVAKNHKESLPSYLCVLGIIDSIVKITLEKDIRGGYSFIKKSFEKRLKKLGIPIHIINPYTQIYAKKYLLGYFHDSVDPVIPIYYLRTEVKEYSDRIFNNKKIFRKFDEKKFLYLLNKPWKFLFYIKISHFFN